MNGWSDATMVQKDLPYPTDSDGELKQLRLPRTDDLDRLLRYGAASHRQLMFAINELERQQRARKGEYVPAPISVEISTPQ